MAGIQMVLDPSHGVPCSLTEVAIVKALLGCMAVHSFRPYSEMFAAFCYPIRIGRGQPDQHYTMNRSVWVI